MIALAAIAEVLTVLLLVQFVRFIEAGEISFGPFNIFFNEADGEFANLSLKFGILSFFAIFLLNVFSACVAWLVGRNANLVGAKIGDMLFHVYSTQKWDFYVQENSNKFIANIVQECQRVTGNIIRPFMILISRTSVTLVLVSVLLYFEPYITSFTVLLVSCCYISIFYFLRNFLLKFSHEVTAGNHFRIRILNEYFGGIKENIISHRWAYAGKLLSEKNRKIALAVGHTQALTQIPKYMIELLVFGLIISSLSLLAFGEFETSSSFIEVAVLFSAAALKLLPGLQQIYNCAAQIRGSVASLDSVLSAIRLGSNGQLNQFDILTKNKSMIITNHFTKVALDRVDYFYPKSDYPVLKNMTLEIKKGEFVGIVGESGSGKSTLLDLILGLIEPTAGTVSWTTKNGVLSKAEFQSLVGFVSQDVFLIDAPIKNNVAMGVPDCQINERRVYKALKLAALSEFVQTASLGIETRVADRGVQLSGGQRQRIALARALYFDPEILVLDEATSALDGETEEKILSTLRELSGVKTVVMISHSEKMLHFCDKVLRLTSGTPLHR